MIAKATWFNRRKYSGWGLTPKSWQGVLYIMVVAFVTSVILSMSLPEPLKLLITAAWIVFILTDFFMAMASIKLDEREQRIEAIAERNASWTMVASTALVILYVATIGKEIKGVDLVPAFIFPIATGVIAKGITNYILDRRGL